MLLPEGASYHVHHGDCIPHLHGMPASSVDMAVFSPPFPTLYAYTSLPEDIGNSEDFRGDAKLHLSFFYRAMIRVLKPGRVMVVHVAQIPRMKRSGGVGLFDFRGLNIRLAERSGFVFEYDWVVRKNPQSQAIRTRSRELQFAGLEGDRAGSRGALPDYLLKFRAPGQNASPIESAGEVSRNDWIGWAEPAWFDIRESDTLNTADAKAEGDTRHICPLQLTVIDRMVRLYSNPGEIVFSPFAGCGSEGVVSLGLGRRFYGCEIKDEYHAITSKRLKRAVSGRIYAPSLFDSPDDASSNPDSAVVLPSLESPPNVSGLTLAETDIEAHSGKKRRDDPFPEEIDLSSTSKSKPKRSRKAKATPLVTPDEQPPANEPHPFLDPLANSCNTCGLEWPAAEGVGCPRCVHGPVDLPCIDSPGGPNWSPSAASTERGPLPLVEKCRAIYRDSRGHDWPCVYKWTLGGLASIVIDEDQESTFGKCRFIKVGLSTVRRDPADPALAGQRKEALFV